MGESIAGWHADGKERKRAGKWECSRAGKWEGMLAGGGEHTGGLGGGHVGRQTNRNRERTLAGRWGG